MSVGRRLAPPTSRIPALPHPLQRLVMTSLSVSLRTMVLVRRREKRMGRRRERRKRVKRMRRKRPIVIGGVQVGGR